MARYDFLEARCVILTPTWPHFTIGKLVMWTGVNNHQIWLLEDRRMILSNVWNDSNFTLNVIYINFSYESGIDSNDQIWFLHAIFEIVWFWLPRGRMNDFEQCLNVLQFNLIVGQCLWPES